MTASKALPAELIDSLLSGYKKPEDLIGENGLLKQLTKALVERALEAEMAAHLGHAKNETVIINPAGNTRNGVHRNLQNAETRKGRPRSFQSPKSGIGLGKHSPQDTILEDIVMHQCRSCMQAGQHDNDPGSDIMKIAQRMTQGAILDRCELHGKESEKHEGFRLRPPQQETQHDLGCQQ